MKAKRQAPQRRDGERRREAAPPKSRRRPVEPTTGRRPKKASAPAREPRAPRSAPQTTPTPRLAERSARPKSTSQAKARAKARKAKAPKVIRPPLRERLLTRLASIDLRPRTLAAKVPFVVLIIGSLGAGLGVTLWLSTDSAERSYQLGNARKTTQLLQQQKEALERDVLQAQAAPALAEAARGLGMIPTKDTAHLIQDPGGNWVVVGTPKPAEGAPPPPLNTKLPDEKPPAPPARPNSVEVPMRVTPGAPVVPGQAGPEVMVRDPNGATTLGTQHLPPPDMPPVPGAPAAPGVVPPPGPLPAPGPPLVVPAAPDVVPPAAAAAPPAAPPVAPPAAAMPVVPVAPPAAPPPTNGEQFGPLTVTTPGAAR
ncbi:hypothetical protein MFM001_30410 [Mycobacterium sp. MFM001]|uniref:hypothetical protein n=1 Tax=Mycobacterium sp. MFM001 TaxID=2049453 RepID=UPI000DA579EE|nr:hypothetical protein [Mycobacterium sp. MFM001]GBE66579.1 hypothetical protein MFM001_30410 [Mycobacterium sp. MFM001]